MSRDIMWTHDHDDHHLDPAMLTKPIESLHTRACVMSRDHQAHQKWLQDLKGA